MRTPVLREHLTSPLIVWLGQIQLYLRHIVSWYFESKSENDMAYFWPWTHKASLVNFSQVDRKAGGNFCPCKIPSNPGNSGLVWETIITVYQYTSSIEVSPGPEMKPDYMYMYQYSETCDERKR